MKRIYLDNAATTPLNGEVKKAMEPYFAEIYGNPNSLHWFGQQARAAVDHARETIANAIGARFREVVFTGSATEGNNLALRGVVKKAKVTFDALQSGKSMKVIVSAIEHDSILNTVRDMEKDGIEVVTIPVNEKGLVDARQVRAALDERTVLVSIMYANNEVGSIQPIAEIAKTIKQFRSREHSLPYYPLFHVDAVQAFNYLECNVDELGVDLMTLSAHKIYGPKGIGALYARILDSVTHVDDDRMYIISPRISGGGQEFGMRSGTENVPAIVGFGEATTIALAMRAQERERLASLKSLFWDGLRELYPEAIMNSDSDENLPNILNIYFPPWKGGELLIAFDLHGIAVSSGSACAARSALPSHALSAMGFDDVRAGGSLRFSFGRHTTEEDIAATLEALKAILVDR